MAARKRRRSSARKGRAKPGRESRRQSPSKVGRRTREKFKHTAASLERQRLGLLADRIAYLEASTVQTMQFATKRAADKAKKDALEELGVLYEVQSKTVGKKTEWRLKRKRISTSAVDASYSMETIRKDLAKRGSSARGAKARALEQLGRRETFWDFAVGDTNES